MASVQYDAATRLYPGTAKPAVNELNLTIADGELLVLVGPSGSGKSTALRMLAGLEPLDEGRILIGGKDVSTRGNFLAKLSAASMIACLPVILAGWAAQKRMIRGLSMGALK